MAEESQVHYQETLRGIYTEPVEVLRVTKFLPDANPSLYDLVDIKDDLEAILQRKVDVVEKTGLRNPFRRRAILGNKVSPQNLHFPNLEL